MIAYDVSRNKDTPFMPRYFLEYTAADQAFPLRCVRMIAGEHSDSTATDKGETSDMLQGLRLLHADWIWFQIYISENHILEDLQ